MKTRILSWALPAIMLFSAFLLTGCQSFTQAHENWGFFGEAARLPIKDFEPVGLVFTEASFEASSRAGGRGSIRGDVFTYQALLRQAHELGAHAIINVTIDRQVGSAESFWRDVQQETWFGSALAIRYTDTLERNTYTIVNGSSLN